MRCGKHRDRGQDLAPILRESKLGANSCTIASTVSCMPSLSLIGNTSTSAVISAPGLDAGYSSKDLRGGGGGSGQIRTR